VIVAHLTPLLETLVTRSVDGTKQISSRVRCSVAIRGKADIEQAALSKPD
jgi:hypothetical protein